MQCNLMYDAVRYGLVSCLSYIINVRSPEIPIMTTYRYYRWDGSQQVFSMDADDLMNSIADDILDHGDPERALRSLFQRGVDDNQGQHAPGLRDLARTAATAATAAA